MIRLNLTPGPQKIDLGQGVMIEVLPPGTEVIVRAGHDMAIRRVPDANDATDRPADRVAFAKAVARAAIIGWTGVADLDGTSLEVSDDTVDALMSNWAAFAAFEARYVNPALVVSAEGNA